MFLFSFQFSLQPQNCPMTGNQDFCSDASNLKLKFRLPIICNDLSRKNYSISIFFLKIYFVDGCELILLSGP